MARLTAEAAGEQAFDVIAIHPGGLNRKIWCLYSGLTSSQLTRALAWLRDLFGQEPVIVNYVQGEPIYKLATIERDAREHVERMLRTQITRARREHNTLHGIAEKFPTIDNEWQAELARRRLTDLRYAYDRLVGQEQLVP
jgi:hypothetical protein